MTKLNQIIAVEKGIKAATHGSFTEAHRQLQKTALLGGISRTYQPVDDEGEQLPPESTKVQVDAESVLAEVATALTKLFDVTATKDWANTDAKADIVVDGATLVSGAPVPYLLFLEKQLTDLHTFVTKLPVLDGAEHWERDHATDSWRTQAVETTRTRKIPRNHVKAEATPQHPAQVEVYFEDKIVGRWSTVKYSGALPQGRVNQILGRLEKLRHAVMFAREQANNTDVSQQHVGEAVFGYLFG